ncbi:DUF4148 domain-containing protein [Candidatus Skiveiella danica]|uniref:DUF4148 domain-containing protein n=2 Tax=Candidatus Skiveiella danica TaxID=3386177 RepID=UPI0039B9B951
MKETIMKSSKFFAVAVLTALAAFASMAQADEADGSQFAAQVTSQRTRAEVQAEASTVSSTRNFHPAGSDVLPPMASTVDRSTVHAQAVERARSGDAHRGEATMM